MKYTFEYLSVTKSGGYSVLFADENGDTHTFWNGTTIMVGLEVEKIKKFKVLSDFAFVNEYLIEGFPKGVIEYLKAFHNKGIEIPF